MTFRITGQRQPPRREHDRGFGDTLHRWLKPLRRILPKLEHCNGCKRRRDIANRLWPYEKSS